MGAYTEPTAQLNFIALVPVLERESDTLEELSARLAELAAVRDRRMGSPLNLGSVPGLHFAHLAVVDAGVRGGRQPALLIATRFDEPNGERVGSERALLGHLRLLTAAAGTAWLDVLEFCVDAPTKLEQTPEYLLAHAISEDACFEATAGRSVDQVHAEAALKERLRKRAEDGHDAARGPKDPHILRRDLVNSVPGLGRFPLQVADASALVFWTAVAVVLCLLWLPLTLPVGLLYLLWLRTAEASEPAVLATAPLAESDSASGSESLTLLVPLKPGRLRRITLRATLWVLRAGLRALGTPESGSPFSGLLGFHYATWALVDGGQQLLFVAVADPGAGLGKLEGYLLKGINAIWSNTQGFPRTEFLCLGGAFDRESFRAWLRQYRIESVVQYSAYPTLSVRTILDNTDVRRGLADSHSQVRVKDWLAKIHA